MARNKTVTDESLCGRKGWQRSRIGQRIRRILRAVQVRVAYNEMAGIVTALSTGMEMQVPADGVRCGVQHEIRSIAEFGGYLMKPLRIAILGQGRSGRDIHGKFLLTRPDRFHVVAAVDPLPHRRALAEKEYNCEVFEHHASLYGRKDIDLVINATPSSLHVPVSIELLKHGFHVLSEKPFARSVEAADRVIEAAKRQDRKLMVFQQSRFAPYFCKTKEIVDSGVLGRIVQVSIAFSGFARRWDWQCLQAFHGGNLLNTGPHPLDQALRFLDTPDMPEVFCRMDRANTFGDAEDYVKVILTAPGRPLVDLEISSCHPYAGFTYDIQGTHGGLKASMNRIEWKYYLPDEAPEQHLVRTPLMKPDGTPAYCSESLILHESSWDVPDDKKDLFATTSAAYYDALFHHFTENRPMPVTLEQVRQQVAVIEACHRQNPLSPLGEMEESGDWT